jgi:drug/metabolite transporter (DMT)-like permease
MGRLFDLRWIIALLFGIYGVVLLVLGIGFETDADRVKTGGFNVNLWMGVGMLALTAFFGLWARLRPVVVEQEAADEAK